ncbi:mitochondrial import protein MMP37 [Verticillium alfalfae VaMs.102]|uniref:Phosphatidate cytidylyltransferase, mitochondrial n=1 Tax=Verticillium alfalfae (strain VaMs.102 / ATCC MYA-4576 / FGSC 10136) TaxID=526221 RepID=C9S6T4_VERA1|nr:mitochondrial import protein MMP37 [Verticillium alfalfae VaMs.102]EEY15187.1 mitochondrial import protein MMP37 [Verticillium alfalfae VaMs.102]
MATPLTQNRLARIAWPSTSQPLSLMRSLRRQRVSAFSYSRLYSEQTSPNTKAGQTKAKDGSHIGEKQQAETKAPTYVHRGSAINFAIGDKYRIREPRDGPPLSAENWEDHPDARLEEFDELPYELFGTNQHIEFHAEFKKELTRLLRSYRAPIMYAFAYGSGIFPQAKPNRHVSDEEYRNVHPKPSQALKEVQASGPKSIDLIFGVTHTQHWHSLNMRQHPEHYSSLAKFGSGLVSTTQERWGAGVYFNPYVIQNGVQIKYGVTSIDNLCTDLSSWNNLYLAGRLQKPVKILRDHPRVRLANQANLISAVRTALLLLPPQFTENELYSTIAGLSYLGDPRMALPTESPSKVTDIVTHNMTSFRKLYGPLLATLPNVDFTATTPDNADPDANAKLSQDMDPTKRANMVRRLPSTFRSRLYFQYQKKFMMPRGEFRALMEASKDEGEESFKRRTGGGFERRIVQDDPAELQEIIRKVIRQTVNWPATAQTIKGFFTAGVRRSLRYVYEKWTKFRAGKAKLAAKKQEEAALKQETSKQETAKKEIKVEVREKTKQE